MKLIRELVLRKKPEIIKGLSNSKKKKINTIKRRINEINPANI